MSDAPEKPFAVVVITEDGGEVVYVPPEVDVFVFDLTRPCTYFLDESETLVEVDSIADDGTVSVRVISSNDGKRNNRILRNILPSRLTFCSDEDVDTDDFLDDDMDEFEVD